VVVVVYTLVVDLQVPVAPVAVVQVTAQPELLIQVAAEVAQ
jgi:hypothetical protein